MEELISGFGLIEGPVYDPTRGLIFSDVINGGVHCLTDDGNAEIVVPHRRGIGGIVQHADGGLIVSGKNIAYKAPGDAPTRVLLEPEAALGGLGFNDITTDAAGRVYAGSLAFRPVAEGDEPKPGHLYVIDLDGTARRLADGILLTNGLGFSPDGNKLYHSDSLRHQVLVYDVQENGNVGPPSPFATIEDGIPDGLAVSEDGAVWVAVAHGSAVKVFEPDGTERQTIPVPLPMVTSLCCGGADRRDLYIVTGSIGSGREDAGTVYRLRVDVAGLPVAPARIKLPG